MKKRVVAGFESAKRSSKNAAEKVSEKAEKRNVARRNLIRKVHDSSNVASEYFSSGDKIQSLTWRCLAAQEDERRRIARELHDGLNQELALMAINLGILQQQTPKEWTRQISLISSLRERMEFLSDGLRKMTHRLHPAVLDHVGLVAAVRSHCAEFSQTAQIPVTFAAVQALKLPSTLAVCLYRIVQEALLNVAKHARATKAFVKIARAPGGILLSIVDNGCGFKCDDLRSSEGLGLVSIRERVQAVKGQLIINSAPGKGMRIEVYAPVGRKEQKREDKGKRETNPLIAG